MISSGSYNVADAEQSQHSSYTNTIVCNVWLLDSTSVAFKVDRQCRGQVLLDLTFDYLELLERDFFGLVYNSPQSRDATILKWLDPTKKIRKQFSDRSPFTFWFRVKFYVPDPVCLHEEYTRYQFFLQVRKDILEGRLPVSKNTAAQLAGLALQSELGDFSSDGCRPGYVSHFRFIQQQTAEFEALAAEWHRKSASTLPSAAELEYLNIARQLDRYGVRTQEVCDAKDNVCSLLLGVSFAGIIAFRTGQSNVQFPWDNVLNIRFIGKKFTVQLKSPVMNVLPAHGSYTALSRQASVSNFASSAALTTFATTPTHTYRFPSAALCKSFWQYSVACHAFFRVREPADMNISAFSRGSMKNSSGATSISATAVHAAVSRMTSGFRRYFSFARRSSLSTNLSGPVGGVERTLSTVMEIRRNSRVFDRSFSRSLSRRSNRYSALGSSNNHSSCLRTTSNLSLSNDRPIDSAPQNNPPVKSYSQIPPAARIPASLGSSAALTSSSTKVSTELPAQATAARYNASGPVTVVRARKIPNPETVIQTTVPQSESHPPVPAARSSQMLRPEKQSRIRSTKPGSPVSGPTNRDCQKRSRTGSPSQGENSVYRPLETKQAKHKPTSSSHPPDNEDSSQPSDRSDHEPGDFDHDEASRYWNMRRSQNAARPVRALSKGRSSAPNQVPEEGEPKPDQHVMGRPPHHPKDGSDITGPIIDGAVRTGGSMRQSSGSRSSLNNTNQSGSHKKSMEGLSVIHRKESKEGEPRTSTNGSSKNHSSHFVRDPFHPGAPASDPREQDTNEGLVLIRIRPDSHKRFGFNVRGGADSQTPIIVSRVGHNMPADLCIPRLSEGDQIISINGRSVSGLTHAEVIGFIRVVREDPTGVLELLVKPGDYVTDELDDNSSVPDSGDAPPLPPRMSQVSSRQSSSSSVLDRFSGNIRRQSVTSGKRDLSLTHSSDSIEVASTPLLLSMLELEYGLADGSILCRFEQLPRRKSGFTMNASRMAANMLKNRYRDISPYDQTRVILQQGSDDYINASFVSMGFPRAGFTINYIAAQGPLPSTYGDFWQMCWEQHVSVVVMLTAVSERGRMKCHQYWPDLGQTIRFSTSSSSSTSTKSSNTFRGSMDLQLQATREETTGDFAFREFTMTHLAAPGGSRSVTETRRVTQLQYITWPDHGVPNNPSDLITFVRKVREKRGTSPEPIIVHCSAGIGRTGVLITLETAWNLMEHGLAVRPLELVQLMRSQRALLIQTTSQFQFVCETILKVFHNEYAKGVLN